jgi:hypothetical protein
MYYEHLHSKLIIFLRNELLEGKLNLEENQTLINAHLFKGDEHD